jgi:ribosome recycling factor
MKITFIEGAPTKQFEKDVENSMMPPIQHFEKDILKIRTNRAHPTMIEDIKVSCYGSIMPLKEVSSISAPDPSLLLVQPWDKANMQEIEKALATSDLGLTPVNDGNVIRIALPKMSSDRRDELIKLLHQKLEQFRSAIRNIRSDVKSLIKDNEKNKSISEYYEHRLQDCLQDVTDKMIAYAEKIAMKKEQEIKH